MSVYLGIDTSNYTTSVCLYDSETNAVISRRKLLPVKGGGKQHPAGLPRHPGRRQHQGGQFPSQQAVPHAHWAQTAIPPAQGGAQPPHRAVIHRLWLYQSVTPCYFHPHFLISLT